MKIGGKNLNDEHQNLKEKVKFVFIQPHRFFCVQGLTIPSQI